MPFTYPFPRPAVTADVLLFAPAASGLEVLLIERAAIRDKQAPLEVFQLMRVQFPEYPPPRLGQWVERFFRLWCRNQWKRERYAPSFHLDDENLDPKTWCRWPILSGGFERELAELAQYVLPQASKAQCGSELP